MIRRLSLAALALGLPLSSYAVDQTVLGNQLAIKASTDLVKRKVIVKAKETTSDDAIVGNPIANGATLEVRATGGTPTSQSFMLTTGTSPSTGKPFWSGDAVKGYKYKDPKGDNGAVKTAQIKKSGSGVFQIKAILDSKLGTLSILPPNNGTGGCALLTLTGGDSYSVAFTTGLLTNKGPTLFKVKKPTAEGTCVTTTTTTSTTTSSSTTSTTLNGLCSNGVLDPGEQCDPPGSACGAFGGTCQLSCTCSCDALDPADCMFPFPSDYMTVPDGTMDTGRRVNFSNAGTPKNNNMMPVESSDYNRNDGFSPGVTILTHVPNVDMAMTGAVPITDIERSFDTNQPIVVINTTTLQRHLIWAEIDSNATSEATRAVIIHPAVNFDENTRYIVALRNMKDGSGAIIPPNADFAAYRDNTPTGHPAKEARRAHMEDLFTTLGLAGIARNDLFLAWDFTVASERNLSERLLFARDDAFARLGSAAPAFVVSNVFEHACTTGSNPFDACQTNADCGVGGVCDTGSTGVDSKIFRRVVGTFWTERYVDNTVPPARFQLDANGLPIHQATPQPASFICNIPYAALPSAAGPAVPARASIYGHGLLGSNDEVSAGNVESMANEHNFVFCATKWIGMSEDDVSTAITILQNFSNFPYLTDRLQQSMVDQLFLARLMIHPNGFIANPAFQDSSNAAVIDPSDVFYDGNSQGGIFGGMVMEIAQDITRGVLGVPGMNYSLLLTRSTDFALYAAILNPSYPNEQQRPLVLALAQMLWDRSDPNGSAHHMTTDPLPNTPQHQVLLHLAFGDHQVANIATEVETRTIGASIHAPAITAGRHSDVNPYFDIPTIPSYPFNGSALVVWDSGAATPPITNTAPSVGADPHSAPRNDVDARQQKSDFLQTGGAVTDVCSGAPCLIP
jgi:hypothetical protein